MLKSLSGIPGIIPQIIVLNIHKGGGTVKCPVCKEPDLVMSERQGIEIDYCPTCRGVWLDRGELDKIIEKSIETMPARQVSGAIPPPPPDPDYYDDHGYHGDHQKHGGHHGYRRRSWLGDLFD